MYHAPTLNTRQARLWLSAITGLVVAALVFTMSPNASAATLFSDNFEDANSSGWTTTAGSWDVRHKDGSYIFYQSSSGYDARALAGATSWTNYAVSARVKPTYFYGSNRLAGIIARAQNNNNYYRLALSNNNTVQISKVVNGTSTALASASATVTLETWYTLKLETAGSTLRGYLNGQLVATTTDTQYPAGNIGLSTYYARAGYDDITVTDTTTTPPTTTPPSSPPPTTTPPTSPPPSSPPPTTPPPTTGIIGWASMAGGTTGGAGGTVVDVDTTSEFLAVVRASGRHVIRVSGMIPLSGMTPVGSDKTILGVGANSGFTGSGLNIDGVSNVIVRNLNFRNSNDDSINVTDGAHHVWIDHNDFATGYDGTVDIKRGADYVTVSWNHSHDQYKDMLLGHDDNNGGQDIGHLRVTYHHNWFDRTAERHPRVRFGNPVHVFNNYTVGASYGVASNMNAGVLVENNYFEDVPEPLVMGVFGTQPGSLVQRGNVFVNCGPPVSGGSVNPIPYSYSLDPGANVKATVMAGAGTGKI